LENLSTRGLQQQHDSSDDSSSSSGDNEKDCRRKKKLSLMRYRRSLVLRKRLPGFKERLFLLPWILQEWNLDNTIRQVQNSLHLFKLDKCVACFFFCCNTILYIRHLFRFQQVSDPHEEILQRARHFRQ